MNTNQPASIAQQIAEVIDRLPLALQRLVLEFAEFLLSRLGPGTEATQSTAESVDSQENTDIAYCSPRLAPTQSDRQKKLLASFQRNAITLPRDYQFNRDEIYDR